MNRIATLIVFSGIFLSSCFMAAAQNLNDSLLVRYHFNGNTVDISGNGWDGIASPNLTYTADRAGNPNYAVYFDGSTTYMDLPGVADLKPQLPVSFSFWVKADDVSLPTAMFTTDYQQNNYHGVFVGYFPDGSGKMSASFGSGSGSTGPASRRTGDADIGIQSGVWSHVVVVLRGAEDMDIYVNCTKATLTYSGSGGSLAYSTSVGSLGRHDTNQNLPPWYFKGAMDDFRYYNRVLNAQDVTLLCDEIPLAASPSTQPASFEIYPNPTAGVPVNIRPSVDGKPFSVALFDAMGTELLAPEDPTTLETSNLAAGIYFVKVVQGKNSFVRKLIVR